MKRVFIDAIIETMMSKNVPSSGNKQFQAKQKADFSNRYLWKVTKNISICLRCIEYISVECIDFVCSVSVQECKK
jgi:hypothetical protein